MNWIELKSGEQLQALQAESTQQPVIIFKHSTRCSISKMVLDRLQRNWNESEVKQVKPYFLDLLSYRDVSNQIADIFDVEHESPQILVINKGQVVFHTSHYSIDYSLVKDVVLQHQKN